MYRFGYTELGPIVADYLSRLHSHILTFESDYGVRPLFVSRAGIRIRRALDAFTASTGLAQPQSAEFFWISRLLVAKGVWNRRHEETLNLLTKEFQHTPLGDFVRAMFRFSPRGAKLSPADIARDATGADLRSFLQGGSATAALVRNFFAHQSTLFEQYLERLIGDREGAILIDTGWQGTAQTLLAKAFPDFAWWGAYFGRFGFADSDRSQWPNMIGLVFESDRYDPSRPETSAVLNRHLFESLFEPAGRSIEWLAQDQHGRIVAPDAGGVLADAPSLEADPTYCGVLAYLGELPRGSSTATFRKNAAEAWQRLAEMMIHPSRDQLRLVGSVTRSADFGRDLKVPLLLPAKPRFEGDTPDLRTREALWPCGQAAVEYQPDVAKALQKRLAGASTPPTAIGQAWRRKQERNRPSVAVITRTMDRPLFLERALLSVARQTHRDYVHVVVNDGGDNDVIKDTIERANIDHARVRLIDGVKNRGMEAASNLAIKLSDSDYVVIHDDDDTWEPEFLCKTVEFLDTRTGDFYGGVITRSTYCSEEVTPSGVVVHDRYPYNGWIENVHLMEMAIENFFPPIAFLFRRRMWEKLGGYNEKYPVLGDWDFNLRFLVEADIGVIPEALANYHHRDRGGLAIFGNSVTAGRNRHVEFASIVRNNFVRSLAQRGHAAAAALAGMGLHLADQRNSLRAARQHLARLNAQESAPSSPGWSDFYWMAFQILLKAVLENDASVLGRLRGGTTPVDGMLARIRQVWPARGSEPERVAMDVLERAAADFVREVTNRSDVVPEVPPPDFDEHAYLRQNPDVCECVRQGEFRSGYEHYVRYGRAEGRQRPTR